MRPRGKHSQDGEQLVDGGALFFSGCREGFPKTIGRFHLPMNQYFICTLGPRRLRIERCHDSIPFLNLGVRSAAHLSNFTLNGGSYFHTERFVSLVEGSV